MVPDLSLSTTGTGADPRHCPPAMLSLSTFGSSSSVAPPAPYCHNHHHHLHQPCVPAAGVLLPPWLAGVSQPYSPASGSTAPSVDLSLLPSETSSDLHTSRCFGLQQTAVLSKLCRELEEGRQNWIQHKKEVNWRLSRLEKQLEVQKARKIREKVQQVEAEIRRLREEESSSLDRIDADYREQLNAILRDADVKEAKMVEVWAGKHSKLARLLERLGVPSCFQIGKELH